MYLHFVTALQRIWLNIGTFNGKIPLNLLEFLNQRFKWLPIIARNHLQAHLKSVHFQKSPTNIYRSFSIFFWFIGLFLCSVFRQALLGHAGFTRHDQNLIYGSLYQSVNSICVKSLVIWIKLFWLSLECQLNLNSSIMYGVQFYLFRWK